MAKKLSRDKLRTRRHLRVRKTVSGTPERPRLSVYRSNGQIYAQLIDDKAGNTIAATSSLKLKLENGGNTDAATQVGAEIGKLAKENKITTVVFDRGGYLYHGRVKALAEAAREAGLEF